MPAEMETKYGRPGPSADMSQPRGGQTVTPSHRGLLTEEVIALRNILGYTDYEKTSTSCDVPDLGNCILGTRLKDIPLVAIDVDAP